MNVETWQKLKTLFHTALDLAPADRAVFLANACDGDAALRSQVEKLLSAHSDAGTFLESSAMVDAGVIPSDEVVGAIDDATRVGERIGPYEIVREMGHGGMGTVFLAVRADDQYRKQVAIKLINRGMDTDLILRRFMMERQILANLEHPNIARLLEGGSTADGLPYFVMEYIEGQPITRYCDAQGLTTPQRLELFREVCAALQYAHQNLVVHRDIKPSNILVTAEGVPKLLDFGIAKLLSPGWDSETGEATASVMRLMTPEYASPEQLRGLSITTASDVYSLGLVLYELLSGHHPYRGTNRGVEEVAQAILQEEPERPSMAARRGDGETGRQGENQVSGKPRLVSRSPRPPFSPSQLQGDVDNIVLKALRKERERRYASVQEFSEDIRRHLEGLPVIASPDTFSYRAGKFIKRNKAAALAVAVVVVTLLMATVITTWQARVARRERAKAEQRFNDVRKLANSVVFELHDSIQNLPGSTPSRELLVSRALEYLDKLASEAGQDRSLQLELAAAYDKIGDIQGGFATSHLGKREQAEESYLKALAIREALVAAEPNNVDFRRRLATSYTRMGEIRWVKVDVTESLKFHGKALEINKKLAAEVPDDPGIGFDLASSYADYGQMLAANGHGDEGLENTRKGLVIIEKLAVADPNNVKIQRRLGYCADRVAEILELIKHDYAEAILIYRKTLAVSERLLKNDPVNTKLRRGKAVSHFNVASVSSKLGDPKTALDNSRQSLLIFKEMSAADPQNQDLHETVAAVQTQVCEMMIKTGNAAEAIELLNQSLLSLEKRFQASPTDETVHFRIAMTEQQLGQGYAALANDNKTSAQKRLTHWREARSWFQKSQAIYKVFREAGKTTGEDGARLDVVTEGIVKCDAAIAQLTQAHK